MRFLVSRKVYIFFEPNENVYFTYRQTWQVTVMYNFWIDPQAPLEVEDIFFNYGSLQHIERGEVLLSMQDNIDAYYFVADGLLAVLSSAFEQSEFFIAKIVPESRAFGFTKIPTLDMSSYEIRALRDSVVYIIKASDMNVIIDSGQLDKRELNNYCRIVRTFDNKAASLIDITDVDTRHTTVINSFRLCNPKYQLYGRTKTLELNSDDIRGINKLYTDYAHLSNRDEFSTLTKSAKSSPGLEGKKRILTSVH